MNRFPINFLLYVTSAALALLCAWTFYLTMKRDQGMSQQDVWEKSEQLSTAGRAQTPDDKRDDYSDATQAWWKTFQVANFIGKPPPEPEGPAVQVVQAPPTPVDFTVESILDVVFIVYGSDEFSRCAVRYKADADVRPPEDEQPGAQPGYAGPRDVTPAPNAARPARGAQQTPTPMPAAFPDDRPMQILKVGEPLWPPYEHIVLARVDETANAVYFSRMDGDQEGEEEKIYRNELGLAQSVLEALAGGQPDAGRPRQVAEEALPPQARGQWVDVEETKAVKPGQWHISRKDNDYLRDNAQEVFSSEVGLRSYVSSGGNVRGIQVMHVSPRLAQFGVQKGDVILELNGTPVKSKAEALRVGKQQHKQGVRTFRAKILSKWGKVEERTYHAPDN